MNESDLKKSLLRKLMLNHLDIFDSDLILTVSFQNNEIIISFDSVYISENYYAHIHPTAALSGYQYVDIIFLKKFESWFKTWVYTTYPELQNRIITINILTY